jgi:hypothetical protein
VTLRDTVCEASNVIQFLLVTSEFYFITSIWTDFRNFGTKMWCATVIHDSVNSVLFVKKIGKGNKTANGWLLLTCINTFTWRCQMTRDHRSSESLLGDWSPRPSETGYPVPCHWIGTWGKPCSHNYYSLLHYARKIFWACMASPLFSADIGKWFP